MKDNITSLIEESIDSKKRLLDNQGNIVDNIKTICNVLTTALENKQKIYFCGNGGSAADAQHLAAELTGRFYKNRQALPAEAIHCNTSYLTAVSNDYSYDIVYARYIQGWGQKGDIVIGLSTSGNSQNIIECFKVCKQKGIITIGFTGESGGALKQFSDYIFKAPSSITPRIQEIHMLVGHIICQLVEEKLFPD